MKNLRSEKFHQEIKEDESKLEETSTRKRKAQDTRNDIGNYKLTVEYLSRSEANYGNFLEKVKNKYRNKD